MRERIEDARVLWEANRIEGAAIQVLIAVAATVRKRYPLPMKDSDAFKAFIKDEIAKITNGPTKNVAFYYDGKHGVTLEDVVYKFVRCELVHEGKLPANIEFTHPVRGPGIPFGRSPSGEPYDGKLFNCIKLYDVLGFPLGWVWNLIRAVAEAPENKHEFPNGSYPIPYDYSVNAGLNLEYPDDHPDRFPPNSPQLRY